MNKNILKIMWELTWKTFTPLVFVCLFINFICLIGAFLFWSTPKIYIPFTSGVIVSAVERFLLIFGFILGILTYENK
jgi:hypothetical protein